jgi:long-chain acyl-CoA synthetase
MLIVSDLQTFRRLQPIAKKIGKLKRIYTFNYYEDVPHWTEITRAGFSNKVKYQDKLKEISSSIQPDDLLTIIYTSGTTGLPKGVMLSHRNIISNVEGVFDLYPIDDNDRILSFLPLCHVYERMVNYLFQWKGCGIYYAENLGTIAQNLAEVRVSAFATVPRVIERIYDRIVSKGEDLRGLKRRIFFMALKLGERYRTNGKHGPWYGFRLRLARKLVFSKWHQAFGGKLKFIISGGAALQPRLSRLFFAAGIPLMDGNIAGYSCQSP